MTKHFEMFARYNAWANERLYDAAAALTDEAYRRDCGAFFRSLEGTLNHLLVADRIWMQRFVGEGSAPDRLDTILFDRLDALRAARAEEDARILRYVERLDSAQLEGVIRYRRVSTPEIHEQPLAPALAHFFNHQTHHRGQAHTILTIVAGKAPELDLLFYCRAAAKSP
jgi:uncharacterized damage-inducible protein DinB